MTIEPKFSAQAWPAAKVEMWAVENLVPYVRNARQHPPEQIDQIAASMQRFGFTILMLVAEDGTVIAGHRFRLPAGQAGAGQRAQGLRILPALQLALLAHQGQGCAKPAIPCVKDRGEARWQKGAVFDRPGDAIERLLQVTGDVAHPHTRRSARRVSCP